MLRTYTEDQLVEWRDAGADVSVLERGINQQVHAFHGPAPKEIKLVEGAAK